MGKWPWPITSKYSISYLFIDISDRSASIACTCITSFEIRTVFIFSENVKSFCVGSCHYSREAKNRPAESRLQSVDHQVLVPLIVETLCCLYFSGRRTLRDTPSCLQRLSNSLWRQSTHPSARAGHDKANLSTHKTYLRFFLDYQASLVNWSQLGLDRCFPGRAPKAREDIQRSGKPYV